MLTLYTENNSQDYAQKPLQNCTFMNSASVFSTLFMEEKGLCTFQPPSNRGQIFSYFAPEKEMVRSRRVGRSERNE